MDEAIHDGSLITVAEADEIVGAPKGVAQALRTPSLLVLGGLLVVVTTLLILLLLSLHSSQTGWESILPFLNPNPKSLQLN